MQASADVTINGPVVDGIQRGVKYMKVGFLQLSTSREYKLTTTDGLVITHAAAGNNAVLDAITKDNNCQLLQNLTWPWYDSVSAQNGNPSGFFEGTNEIAQVQRHFAVSDTPHSPLTPAFIRVGNNVLSPAHIDINWQFELNVAVHTRDPDLVVDEDIQKDDENRFTTRARGEWSWIGDASFSQQNGWTIDDNAATAVVQALQEKTNGERVKPWFNIGSNAPQYLNVFLIAWGEAVNGQFIIDPIHPTQ